MEKYYDILQRCPLFEGIEREELSALLSCLSVRVGRFDKKQAVFDEGSPARYVGVLLSGSLRISHVDYFGKNSILGAVEAGEVFAEAFACSGMENMPVAVVATEESEVMLAEVSHILHTCKKGCAFHQRLIYNLMGDLAKKTVQLHTRARIISKRTTREKLLTYLAGCAKEAGGGGFTVPYDRQELADFLEVDRSGLSAEIGRLTKEGVLISRRSYFELL